MSAAISACAGPSSLPVQRRASPALDLRQRARRLGAHLGHRRAAGQPHQPLDECARRRAADFLLVWRCGRGLNVAARSASMTSVRPGQRRIDRVLRDHARRAIRLQHEPDRHVRGDRRRADRIERIAGVAREQLAVHAPARRPRRDLRRARVFGSASSDGFSVAASASSAARCSAARHPLGRHAIVAAEGVDVVLAADRRCRRFDRVAVVHVERHQRLFHRRHRRVLLDHRLVEAVERGAADLHDAIQLRGHVDRAVVPLVGARRRVRVLVGQVDAGPAPTRRPGSSAAPPARRCPCGKS